MQDVRRKGRPSIQQHCGEMKVLDMSQPIGLSDIYTSVNILDRITGCRGIAIADLMQDCKPEEFGRFGLGRVAEERVPGLKAVEKYSKLIVLGKPGAGKTTFLKHLAIQCNGGEFQAHRVPIFITLKDFAEAKEQPDLLGYITQKFSNCGVTAEQVGQLLSHGRAMVLLDGLDEVRKADNSRVLKQIRDFSAQFKTNHFVMTCRIAAQEYTFEKFTEVEVADFDDQQIVAFATKWFQAQCSVNAEIFIKKLQDNKPIQELATNPLLLTLLCLDFEESLDFPANRSDLYNRALKVMLSKWDAKRGIERDEIYRKLSVQRKEDLLSQLAITTFERGDYFFKQKELERHIADYICNLIDAQTEPDALQLDSEAVLKSIEAQHGLLVERARGIYSFSHLTFQEYFTARKICASPEALKHMVNHITENRWREVFLLTVGMLQNADELLLLMNQQINVLVASDEKLQKFLNWVSQKSRSVQVHYKPAAVRAFYLGYEVDVSHAFARDLDPHLDAKLNVTLALNLKLPPSLKLELALSLNRQLALELYLGVALCIDSVRIHAFNLALDLAHNVDPELEQVLLKLYEQLPEPDRDKEILEQWWETHGQFWTGQLRAVMIEHRQIGHNWQFNNQHKEVLAQYYDANKLLVDCLNSDCYVTHDVREEVKETLLLPANEIKKWKPNS